MPPVRALSAFAVGAATAVVVLALAVAPFLTPAWVGFEQQRSGAEAWTHFAPADLRHATDAILSDLVLGPPAFDIVVDGLPVLTEREREHMGDVRGVFAGFYALAGICAAVVGAAAIAARGSMHRRVWFWKSVRRGATGLAVGVVGIAIVAVLAFDAAFAVFHQVFFSPGSYTFDPLTDRIVQLFPDAFWFETSLVVGAVVFVLPIGLRRLAGGRIGRPAREVGRDPLQARAAGAR